MRVLQIPLPSFALLMLLSVVLGALNFPLHRFPWQDLLWNDLVLLSRVAWMSEALLNRPLATIDFLQGLGADITQDVKVLYHFYDPGVLLALFLNPKLALFWRTILLNFYCLICLHHLIVRQLAHSPFHERSHGLRYALMLLYVLSPQFFYEVSHHFTAVFYVLPGLLLSAHMVLHQRSSLHILHYVLACTLFVSLSDLHIVFTSGTLLIFTLIFDHHIRSARAREVSLLALVFIVIVAASFLPPLLSFGSQDIAVSGGGGRSFVDYSQNFLQPAFSSFFLPHFVGPLCPYIAPYLAIFLLVVISRQKYPRLFQELLLLLTLFVALYLVGGVAHYIEITRSRLPSDLRYHLAIIPFLGVLWMVFRADSLCAIFKTHGAARTIQYPIICVLVGYAIAFAYHAESISSLASPSIDILISALICLCSFWLMASDSLMRTEVKRLWRTTLCFSLSVLMIALLGISRSLIQGAQIDSNLYVLLYKDVPHRINKVIQNSQYSQASRSFVPVARGYFNEDRGINDKLLPLIEYPEALLGRAFFHWRYSYNAHIAQLYGDVLGRVGVCLFPPPHKREKEAIDFAFATDSPFILAADTKLSDPRVSLLDTIDLNSMVKGSPIPGNISLYGILRLYVIPELAEVSPPTGFSFSRTAMALSLQPSQSGAIRLPISFYESLRAYDQEGIALRLSSSEDGFAVLHPRERSHYVTISSHSSLRILALIAPFLGAFIFAFNRWLDPQRNGS